MKRKLWTRLKQYHFDNLVPPQLWDHVRSAFGNTNSSTQAFASKIARKLKWERGFALRAIDEYRKFVYLGMIADFHVTPPKIIDQVWHEHLLFSRAYREFCRDVLQHDFDHHPELLPSDGQTELFQAQYEATLELYRLEFNVRPPADIWGTPKFRLGSVRPNADMPRKQRDDASDASLPYFGETPLYQHFDGGESGSHHQHMAEFGGGGGFSGGGGGDSWGDGHSQSSPSVSGSSDGGSGSGDASSSDGGGSSGCSSGCGGGGD